MESCVRPSQAFTDFSVTVTGFLRGLASVVPLSSYLWAVSPWGAVSLKGLVCDQNLLSGRKKVPSPTQMPARQGMVPSGHRTLIFCNSDCFV